MSVSLVFALVGESAVSPTNISYNTLVVGHAALFLILQFAAEVFSTVQVTAGGLVFALVGR